MTEELSELEEIDGVGAKTAERLAELDDPRAALKAGDVARIARAPGVSEGRAARIARAAIRHRHDDSSEFLATERARELYESVLELLKERAVTGYGKRRLETLYPSASMDRIAEVREFAEAAVNREPTAEVLEALSGVEPLETARDVRIRDRCLATNDVETFSKAQDGVPELSVELVEYPRARSTATSGSDRGSSKRRLRSSPSERSGSSPGTARGSGRPRPSTGVRGWSRRAISTRSRTPSKGSMRTGPSPGTNS